MKRIVLVFVIAMSLLPVSSFAQGEVVEDKHDILKAKVVEVLEDRPVDVPGLDTSIKSNYQRLRVQIIDGDRKGEELVIENDYLHLKKGEKFYLLENTRWEDGLKTYSVYERYRLPALLLLVIIFLLCLFIFGGIQGVRGLASLVGSILLIVFVLMPGILHGYSPILVTIGVSSLIIIVGSYVTHGFNRTTSSAVVGMLAVVLITGLLAYFAVHLASLSGFESEESIYLNFNTGGKIDFVGLLFGGIMIGLLGVLYDVAIGQAIAVEELKEAGKHYDRKQILKRGIRIGKEHTGALINTLAIAYVGVSLPLLLLFYGSTEASFLEIVNREVFATEIVRTLVGSIGLILAVPITTLISVLLLVKKDK